MNTYLGYFIGYLINFFISNGFAMCEQSTINTSNHAEILKLQTHLHHAKIKP